MPSPVDIQIKLNTSKQNGIFKIITCLSDNINKETLQKMKEVQTNKPTFSIASIALVPTVGETCLLAFC